MSEGAIFESEPREIVRVEVDPHADMHDPDRPYRLTLWDPEDNVHESDVPHACRNLTWVELEALGRVVTALLEGGPQ